MGEKLEPTAKRAHNKRARKANWLERNATSYTVFKGVLYAGLILSALNWGGLILYEFAIRN